ncbi:hypothetical protein IN07_07500 [Modestobacter caceresii]|uniref:Uncharacterized protein n=1 Tax=Modestobacter caceresii TaxID=1522368 RepID=A0A098Y9B6_9ACTN|nr:hypothetical protein [Modestobacter caceresii]KGH47443.1 hypothetical protein IN07_07500 [Modestobacter caceresii]
MARQKREKRQEPPILRLEKADSEWAQKVLAEIDHVVRGIEGSPKRTQFVSMLIDPGTKTGRAQWRDDHDRPKTEQRAASRVARARLRVISTLRDSGMSRKSVGDVMGLTGDAVKALEDRAAQTRATQVRISRRDAALLAQAKEAARGGDGDVRWSNTDVAR